MIDCDRDKGENSKAFSLLLCMYGEKKPFTINIIFAWTSCWYDITTSQQCQHELMVVSGDALCGRFMFTVHFAQMCL